MTEEDLRQNQEVQETTPEAGSESSEASEDFESLFADDSNDDSQEDAQAKIERLQKEVERLSKGFNKAFSEKGRANKSSEPKAEIPGGAASVIKNLYFKANPEASEIWDEVEKTAKQLGKDPFELYEASAYLKGEAKARAEARKVEEENKAKISKPSNDVAFSKNIASVREEDIHKLKPDEKVKWLEAMVQKEKSNTN